MAKSTTTIAATTSRAGFLTIFQIVFCQSVAKDLGCMRPPGCLYDHRAFQGVPPVRKFPSWPQIEPTECKFNADKGKVSDYVHWVDASGSRRARFPVSAKSALATAGATGGVPGSPTPVGWSPPGARCTSTSGISFMRSTR